MTARRRQRVVDALCAALVTLAVAAGWCVAYSRTSAAAWDTPISYRGDSLFQTASLRAGRDLHLVPGRHVFVPELNAPYGASWNDHPRTLRVVFFSAGLLSRAAGLFLTLNLVLLLSHLLAGIAFFAAARGFGARREWAVAGGVVFGLSHYLFWRSTDHINLAVAWHLPLCVLVVGWAFSRRGIPLRSRRFAAAAAVAVVAGLHDPYYGSLFGQFLLLASAAQAVRWRRGGRPGPALVLAGLVLASYLVDNLGWLAVQLGPDRNAASVRPFGNLERYALKPLELVLPAPGFGLGNWGRLSRVYWEGRLYRGEGGAAYLGLAGVAALVWLAGVALYRAARRPPRPMPPAALGILWILGFSVVGGLNEMLGIAGFTWLRGTNRFSVWILVLTLLYLVTRRYPRAAPGFAVAALVTAVAVADQLPRHRPEEIARTRLEVARDREFVRATEALLPANAMLFTMPVIEFPEGVPVLKAEEYEHLRFFLHSRQLRFSFGGDKGRPRESWQQAVAALPAPQLIAALEACGFSGILVNRKGYVSSAQELLGEMQAAGRPVTLRHPADDYVLVALHPRPDPQLPWGSAGPAPASVAREVCGVSVPPTAPAASR